MDIVPSPVAPTTSVRPAMDAYPSGPAGVLDHQPLDFGDDEGDDDEDHDAAAAQQVHRVSRTSCPSSLPDHRQISRSPPCPPGALAYLPVFGFYPGVATCGSWPLLWFSSLLLARACCAVLSCTVLPWRAY